VGAEVIPLGGDGGDHYGAQQDGGRPQCPLALRLLARVAAELEPTQNSTKTTAAARTM
jgi:hypothetical protein